MENGAKLGPNYNQILPKSNSQLKPLKQATHKSFGPYKWKLSEEII